MHKGKITSKMDRLYFSSSLKCLNIFEVNKHKIEPHFIEDTECSFHKGISTIDYVNANPNFGYDFQIFPRDLTFYQLIPDFMQGKNYRMEEGDLYQVIFEPTKLKETTDKPVKIAQYFKHRTHNPIAKGELENLEKLSEILDLIQIMNGLVSISNG
jgi:hypothetical protein